ncbi:MAG: DUF3943 domain-containing protein [Chitinophagaceae bacterium]
MKAVPVSFLSLFFLVYHSTIGFSQKLENMPDKKLESGSDSLYFLLHKISSADPSLSKKHHTFVSSSAASPQDSSSSSSFSYSYTYRNEERSYGKKFMRGEKLIGGSELVGMGILILLPKKVTKWQDDWMQDAMRNLKRSWTHMPVWDHDTWVFNYVGHPIAGSYYYNAVRSQKASVLGSFAFSAFQSTFWEYVVEGIAERPSIQDLFVTPIGGAILGEATHQITLKMQRNGFSFFEKAFVIVLNPMYAINNGFKKKYRRIPLYN